MLTPNIAEGETSQAAQPECSLTLLELKGVGNPRLQRVACHHSTQVYT